MSLEHSTVSFVQSVIQQSMDCFLLLTTTGALLRVFVAKHFLLKLKNLAKVIICLVATFIIVTISSRQKTKIRQWFPLEEIAQFGFHLNKIFSHLFIFMENQLKVIIDSNNGWESTWDFETSRFNGL